MHNNGSHAGGVTIVQSQIVQAAPSLTMSTRDVDERGFLRGETFTDRELRKWCREGLRCVAGTDGHVIVLRADLESFVREHGRPLDRAAGRRASAAAEEDEDFALLAAGGVRLAARR